MSEKTIDEIVKTARERLAQMSALPENARTVEDIERAIDGLVRLLPSQSITHFYELVAKVEERFRKAYEGEIVGNAKTEAQMDADQVSTGWWIILSRLGVAIRTGDAEPEFKPGDTVIFTMQRGPKP